jgi:DNA polymerase-3 subunit delta'
MTDTILPWQQKQWQQLLTTAKTGRLGHAWLFSGMVGLGKMQFAQMFAQTLLCEHGLELNAPCTTCRHCMWFNQVSHPKFQLIQADEKQIKIEQIRNLTTTLVNTQAANQCHIVIIYPAEAMHSSAANALLKTLEEPVSNSLLILVSHQPAKLPITIRSRCQHLVFQPTYSPETLNWLQPQLSQQQDAAVLLKLANGSPIQALQLAQNNDLLHMQGVLIQQLLAIAKQQTDPSTVAINFLPMPLDTVLVYLLGIVSDIMRLQLKLPQQFIINQAQINLLQELMAFIKLFKLFEFSDKLYQHRKQVQGNLNQQLVLEDIFCQWYTITHE